MKSEHLAHLTKIISLAKQIGIEAEAMDKEELA
jgi:hypothetical protein